MLTERSKRTIIFELYISKICQLNNIMYGVVVEGQAIVLEYDGSNPGHDSFEKVINFFSYLASFCLT
jgi:hypothetical protein